MNALIAAVFACLAVANAEVILKGPSGVVTSHGPIGPSGPAHGDYYHGDDGSYHGEGAYDDGSYHGEGAYLGEGAYGHGAYGHGVAIIAPAAPKVYIAGPAAHAAPYHGYAGYGYAGHGYEHGVAVKGPHTVPAVVAGPSGKIVAHGLYGVPHHHY